MTIIRHRARIVLSGVALLVVILTSGCAGLRRAGVPVDPPAEYLGVAQSARDGFHAVYDGELRIWFHSFRAIWYVAAQPDGAQLAIAVLSPTGVNIVQMHGDASGHVFVAGMPAAERLQPYGSALWQALWWSLAVGDRPPEAEWVRRGDTVRGRATRDEVRVCYQTDADHGDEVRIVLRDADRGRQTVRLADVRVEENRAYPGRIHIRTVRPRCRLTLFLKSIQWRETVEDDSYDAGP